MTIEFGDLVKVRHLGWRIAVQDDGPFVYIITKSNPTWTDELVSYRKVGREDILDHYCRTGIPTAIRALKRIKAKLDALGTDLDGIYADAEDALRAVRGEDAK
jgi:hypothetical protein